MEQDIMKFESVLPANFDGTFKFTNWSDEDFFGKWDSKEYLFKAHTTSPMVILNATPLDIQQIRKKFAKDLAVREYEKSAAFEVLKKQERNADGTPRLNSIHQAGSYGLDQLTPYIQRALEPLPVSEAVVRPAPIRSVEDSLTKDDEGLPNTIAVKKDGDLIDERKSLKRKALGA